MKRKAFKSMTLTNRTKGVNNKVDAHTYENIII